MNLLINATSARLGGGQTYLMNLLELFPPGKDIKIYIYAPNSLDLPKNINIVKLNTIWPVDNPLLRSVWEKLFLPRILKKLKIDVLFCPGGLINTPVPNSCKTVTMFRNMIPFDLAIRRKIPYGVKRLRNYFLEKLMLKSMANADLVIFISNFARELIENKITIKKAITIHHGLSAHFKSEGLDRRDLSRPSFLPENEYLLYVSRFDVYKHHYELVTAYSMLPQNIRDKFSLVLVGETNASEYARVAELIENLFLKDYIFIVGAIPYKTLPSVYKFAYANIFASSCENCPNILLEAMGAGRPVLSSNIMPMPEFGENAVIYFSPFCPEELATQIMKLLTSKQITNEYAILALKQSKKFDWSITAEATWKIIYQLKT